MRPLTRRRALVLLALLVGGLLLAACGDDTDSSPFEPVADETSDEPSADEPAEDQADSVPAADPSGTDRSGELVQTWEIVEFTGIATEGQACEGFLGEQDRDLSSDIAGVTRFFFDEERAPVLVDEFLLVKAVPA